jgi:hypothetical protein
VAYIFSAHIITMIMFGHNSKIATLMFLPLILLATDEIWDRPSLRWTSILALAVGNMLASSHLQIAYYTLLAAGLYLLVATVYSLKAGKKAVSILGSWGAWVGGLVVGLGSAAVIFLPVREYAEHSIRGGTGGGLSYDYATNWSLHPLEMTTFFMPSFMGFGSSTYWGWMPFTDFPHYMGILVLFLAVLTAVLWPKNRLHLYLIVLALLSLLLSFGRHLPLFYNLMFEVFPYFNKFRVPSMILVLFQFAVAMLAAVGLHRLATMQDAAERSRIMRRFRIVGGIFLALVLILGGVVASGGLDDTIARRLGERAPVFGLTPDQVPLFVSQYAPRIKGMVGTDTVVVALILVLGLALMWARLSGRMSGAFLAAGVLVLVVADLWQVDHRPVTYQPRKGELDSFVVTPAVRFLQDDPEPFRVLPLTGGGTGNNLFAYYRLSSILGYHAAKLQIYQDLIDENGPVGISRSLSQGNFNVASMLNMKYVIADQEIGGGGLETVFRGNQFVIRNNASLPRMWFVDRARVVADSDQHLRAVADPSWAPGEEALLFEDIGPLDPGEGGTASITTYEPREIEATLTSPGNSLLMISEVHYQPGWDAWLDGEPVDLHRANYVLKAMKVPPGTHQLRMRFDPPAFRQGITISLAAYGLIGLGLVASFFAGRRRVSVEA